MKLVITNAGRVALTDQAGGTRAVRIASVGVSATAVTPSATATALPGEIKRITTIAGDAVGPDVVHLIVRDETDASYVLRSFALYLADGTLFAIYGEAQPILEKSARATMLLAVDVTITDVSAAQITFGATNFLNPPATTERAGVVELATDAEATALTDRLRALTPAALAQVFTAANVLSRLLNVDGSGSGLDADLLDGRHLGTNGDAIPSLAGNNSWGGLQTFVGGGIQTTHTAGAGAGVGGLAFFNSAPSNGWWAGFQAVRPAGSEGVNFIELRFVTTNGTPAERMRITADGMVGIGILAPQHRLHVGGNIGLTGGIIAGGGLTMVGMVRSSVNAAAGEIVGGHESYNGPQTSGWWSGVRSYVPEGAGGRDLVDLRFYTTGGAAFERMRITPSGRVAIGLTAPAYLFHVGGDAGFDGAVFRNGQGRFLHWNERYPGGSVSRGTAEPGGGFDGDIYLQFDATAKTLRLWHRITDQWLRAS